jgi:HAD superfamily hydrolase (TIGR01450 family)
MEPVTSHQPLSAAYDGIVCDLDGVVYRGARAVPGAPEALQQLAVRGVGIVYATNNASRVPRDVAVQLSEVGAPCEPSQIVTSAEAGAARLAADLPPGSPVLALGGPGVAYALWEAGLTPVPPDDEDRRVNAVLQGFGRELTVRNFENAARHLAVGAVWVATNDDETLPLEWGVSPGNGAYVTLLSGAAGRRPLVTGKPHRPLYDLSVSRLGTDPGRTLAVGDRLDTDIAGAVEAGIDSAWVLTGVGRPSDLFASTDLPPPTYVVRDLASLLQPYAVPRADGPSWVCGPARVRLDDTLTVEARGPDVGEVVRAGLTALVAEGARSARPLERLSALARVLDELLDDHLQSVDRAVASRDQATGDCSGQRSGHGRGDVGRPSDEPVA